MPAPLELDPTASPLAFFGAELRKYRKRAKLSQEQLAEIIKFSPSLVGLIERAQRTPSKDLVQRCDEAVGAEGELLRLWPLISREASPRWFREWLDIEQEAQSLRTWQPLLIPGLLQTEDYARAMLRGEPGVTDEQVEKSVQARLERQIIWSRPSPPMFWVLLDEGVLQRPIGGREVICHQFHHLVKMVERPHIAIQVVPMAFGATTGLLGGFVIAQLAGSPDIVYYESTGHGQVTDQPEDVAAIHLKYDAIRAEAHPQHVSVELLREAAKTWT